jgi:hypothetical protein
MSSNIDHDVIKVPVESKEEVILISGKSVKKLKKMCMTVNLDTCVK